MDEDIGGRIAANVAFYRRLRGYTQKQVAKNLGCTTQLISRYENCRCGIPAGVLYNLSNSLDVPIQDFFCRPVEIVAGHKNLLSARSIGEALAGLDSPEIRAAIAGLIDKALQMQATR